MRDNIGRGGYSCRGWRQVRSCFREWRGHPLVEENHNEKSKAGRREDGEMHGSSNRRSADVSKTAAQKTKAGSTHLKYPVRPFPSIIGRCVREESRRWYDRSGEGRKWLRYSTRNQPMFAASPGLNMPQSPCVHADHGQSLLK